ncbi:minor structural protein GP20 [Psychrobacillus insolitus]|uniref:Minor structural protein GP20 n=1 Tax=Psychrobacillus insolitus TaxID=1461 RepID=A0A2W7PHV0_9BACI|nr:phage scaffolding protein [Psychrobacillus insolitus]PZX07906.1 minor structural protein GP20 [Psychrobacillus insolitus]
MNKEQLVALGLTEEQADNVITGFGTMIPKTRLDDKIKEVTELKEQITNRDTQLKELSGKVVDNVELSAQIKQLQEKNETSTSEFQKALLQKEFDFALERALNGAKAKNPKAVKALLNTETLKLDGETLLGLDDQLKVLKESDDYLFESDSLQGRTPPGGKQHVPGGYNKPNPFAKESFNLTEQGNLYRDNPDLASQLKTLAK